MDYTNHMERMDIRIENDIRRKIIEMGGTSRMSDLATMSFESNSKASILPLEVGLVLRSVIEMETFCVAIKPLDDGDEDTLIEQVGPQFRDFVRDLLASEHYKHWKFIDVKVLHGTENTKKKCHFRLTLQIARIGRSTD